MTTAGVIVLIILLLAGGGIAAYFFLFLPKKAGRLIRPDQRVFLHCLQGSLPGKVFLLSRGFINIGRSQNNHISLPSDDLTVSRNHATIFFRQGQYFIIDRGSSNGTLVNGNKIPQGSQVPLSANAIIRIGRQSYQLKVELPRTPPPAPWGPKIPTPKPWTTDPSPPQPPPPASDVLPGGFTRTSKIGVGAMADVFKGVDRKGQTVAIKMPMEATLLDPESQARFKRELELGRRLVHPNIVRLIYGGEYYKRPFMVMEYVDGGSLRDFLVKSGAVSWSTFQGIASDCFMALDYAHSCHVVHRDIKPENILLTKMGQAKVNDFGVARYLNTGTITQAGTIIGTILYMSPEQAQAGEIDHRSDLYSFGVVAYEMLTGRRPFDGQDAEVILAQHISAQPKPPRKIRPELSVEVEEAIMRSLEKKPEDRFQSAKEMACALHCWQTKEKEVR